jgi:hypothetical protein
MPRLLIVRLAVKPRVPGRLVPEELAMQDLLMVFLTVIFFVIALLYVRGCEKLR